MSNTTSGVKSVSILCRTFDGDAQWLERTLPTWLEHCQGYAEIVACGIREQCSKVIELCEKHDVPFVSDDESAQIAHGYINQQYTKMRADKFVHGDYVLYLDSDTVCCYEHTPDLWFENGKPVLMYSKWDSVGDALCWRAPTTHLVGEVPEYEFMRRLPLMYPVSVVSGARHYIEALHGKTLLELIQPMKSLSEFNAIGAYAHQHRRDEFHWHNPQMDGVPENPFTQYWSHGGVQQLDA